MPIRERLAAKEIHRDFRRLRSIRSAGGGLVPHTLLGQVHSDTVIAAPIQGSLIVADSTPEWSQLEHPAAPGYALVTDATDVAWDQTPTWTGDHTWDDDAGDSPANHFITGSNDQFSMWAENDVTPGDSDFVFKFPAADSDSFFVFRDSADNDVAWVNADGNTTWDGAAHRFGIADTVSAIVTVSGHATGSDEGGQLTLELADDYDGAFDAWVIDAWQDDLRFLTGPVINVMTAEGQLQLPTAGAAAGVLVGGDAQWYRSGANVMATPDDLYLAGAGLGIIHVDGVAAGQYLRANGTRYVPNTIQVGDVPGMDAQFVTMALDGDLANERVLTGGDSLTLTDGGAGGNATLDLDLPGTLTVATANNAAAPHLHTITSSSNPGAAASILASDANGYLTLVSLGIGTVPGNANVIKMADDAWIGIGAGGARLVFDSTPAPDEIRVETANFDLNGNDLILSAGGGSYLHESAAEIVDLVLAGAAGEFGIHINGAEDFTFTANALNVIEGSALYWSEYAYHYGDADTYIRYQDDNITLAAGGVSMVDAVEGAVDYVDFPAGLVFVDRTNANAFMTQGINIDQAGAGDHIFSLNSDGDVAHGMTDEANTECYAFVSKFQDNTGGFMLTGLKESGETNAHAIRLRGFLGEPPQTTKTAASYGVISIGGWEKNGTTVKAIAAAGSNLLSVDNNGDTVMIVDIDGGLWMTGTADFSDGGVRTIWSEANVSSPPTDAELDAAFGTPAAVGEGFHALVDDNNANTAGWAVWSLGGSWWYAAGLTKAV